MTTPTINYAGTVLINDKFQMLFVFTDGMWDFPCDMVKAGESSKQSALRAVVEKTNVDPANIRILKELPDILEMEGNTIIKTKLYICEYETNPDYILRASFEGDGVFESKWFYMSALPIYATSISNKYIIGFLYKFLSRTSILSKLPPKS